MDFGTEGKETWYVIFEKSNIKHWIFKLIHKDISHCYAVKKSQGGYYWVIVDGKYPRVEVNIQPLTLYPTVRDLVGDKALILTIKKEYNLEKAIHHLNIMTCVDIVKGVLGIRDFWCWTPYQLYKRLRHEQSSK